MALVIAAIAVVVAVGSSDSDGGPGLSGEGGAGTGEAMTVDVELREFSVEPAAVDVPAGTELTLRVTNAGEMPHDLKLDGQTGTDMLDPGGSETVELGAIDATSQAWCTVAGHKEAGMVFDINVTGGAATSEGESTSTAATIDMDAEPAADWQPYDPALEPAPGGTEHEVTVHATETELEVAPGVTQTMWTFDGKVPVR